MSTWAVLATGPSMSQAVADTVRGRCGVIVVSDAYLLAPWADALVSGDRKWWNAHHDAFKFAGRKFCGNRSTEGVEFFKPDHMHGVGSNSGLQGMRIARDKFGATKILLCGFDMQGSHFFGSHRPPLRDTPSSRREIHKRQFAKFDTTNCRVVNCTPGSQLEYFPFGELEEELDELLRAG